MKPSNSDVWHILMVDDDEDDYLITRSMLGQAQGRKIELDWAPTYQDGLKLLQSKAYHAVLVDYDLGIPTGIDLIRETVTRGCTAPLILYTGRGSYETDVEAMKAGATLYITKMEATPLLLERSLRYAIELKRVEQELELARAEAEKEKHRLEAVMQALPVGIAITDAKGGHLEANSAYDRIWGEPRPDPKSIRDYEAFKAWWGDSGRAVSPEEWASAQAVQQGKTITGQLLEIQRFDGSHAYILNSAAPVRNASGAIIGSAVAIQDITKLREAEAALLEANMTLQEQAEELEVQTEELQSQTEELETANLNLLLINERQSILSDAAAELLAGADPLARLDDFFQRVSKNLGLEVYVLYRVSNDGTHLELGRLRGFPRRYHKILQRLEFGQAVCGTVAQTCTPMYVNDVQGSKDRKTRLIRSMGIGSYACHPLIVEGRLLGTLSFGSRTCTEFDPVTIDLLRTFCNLVATAMARQQVEEHLRQRVEEIEKLMDLVPAAIWVAHDPGCYQITGNRLANQFYEAMEGENVSAGPEPGKTVGPRRFFRDGRELAAGELPMQEAAAKNIEVRGAEFEVLLPSGQWRALLGSATPLHDEGQVRGCLAAFVDITERKQAEEALANAKERLEKTLNSITNGFYTLDSEWRFVAVNRKAEEHFGAPRDQLLGRNIWELAGTPADSLLYRQFHQAAAKGQPAQFEAESGIHPGFWAELHLYPHAHGLDVYFADISARKHVEGALREANAALQRQAEKLENQAEELQMQADALLISNEKLSETEKKIRFQNAILQGINRIFREALTSNTEEHLGGTCLAVAEEITQSKFGFIADIGADGYLHDIAFSDPGWALCSMPDKTGHRRPPGDFTVHGLYGRVLQDGKSLLTNTPAEHPDSIGTPPGHPPLRAFLGVPLSQAGRTTGIIAVGNREGGYTQAEVEALEALAPVVVEAFSRKRAEIGLQIRAEQLKHSNQALQDFASVAAHDLQEPLRKVQAYGEMLKSTSSQGLDDQGKVFVERMQTAARRMESMLEGLLDYSRVTTRGQPFAKVDLNQIATEVLSDLDVRLSQSDGRVELGELPVLEADPVQMRQLLQNLIGNALKFHRPGVTPVVKIYAKEGNRGVGGRGKGNRDGDDQPPDSPILYSPLPYSPDCIEILVQDNGIGFDMSYANQLFQPFKRLHPKSEFEGSGMGLAICRKIVERHGGEITVQSVPGEGSTFTVRLPARP